MFKDVPKLEGDTEQGFEIRSVLLWQSIGVVSVSLLSNFFLLSWFSVLFGGFGVILSTWHVHQSVYSSNGDRVVLLKAAGIRFSIFLLILAAGVFFLELQPVALIAGMAVAYIVMYVRSLIMIFRQMKGDSLG